MVRHFPVLHFQVVHFQSPRCVATQSGGREAMYKARLLIAAALLITAASATYIPWNGRGAPAGGEVSSLPGGDGGGGMPRSNGVGLETASETDRPRHKSVFRNDAVRSLPISLVAVA